EFPPEKGSSHNSDALHRDIFSRRMGRAARPARAEASVQGNRKARLGIGGSGSVAVPHRAGRRNVFRRSPCSVLRAGCVARVSRRPVLVCATPCALCRELRFRIRLDGSRFEAAVVVTMALVAYVAGWLILAVSETLSNTWRRLRRADVREGPGRPL